MDISIEAIMGFITVLSFLAAMTPTEKDDKVLGRIKNLLNKLRGQ